MKSCTGTYFLFSTIVPYCPVINRKLLRGSTFVSTWNILLLSFFVTEKLGLKLACSSCTLYYFISVLIPTVHVHGIGSIFSSFTIVDGG